MVNCSYYVSITPFLDQLNKIPFQEWQLLSTHNLHSDILPLTLFQSISNCFKFTNCRAANSYSSIRVAVKILHRIVVPYKFVRAIH